MAGIELNEYQEAAKQFACYGQPVYPFFSIGEEAGEVQGKIAKYIRKNKTLPDLSNEELKAALVKELGDVLWQLSACATELGVTLEDIAVGNLEKLAGRKVRGTLIGEGDDR